MAAGGGLGQLFSSIYPRGTVREVRGGGGKGQRGSERGRGGGGEIDIEGEREALQA